MKNFWTNTNNRVNKLLLPKNNLVAVLLICSLFAQLVLPVVAFANEVVENTTEAEEIHEDEGGDENNNETESISETDVITETGDATAGTTIDNETNTNITDTSDKTDESESDSEEETDITQEDGEDSSVESNDNSPENLDDTDTNTATSTKGSDSDVTLKNKGEIATSTASTTNDSTGTSSKNTILDKPEDSKTPTVTATSTNKDDRLQTSTSTDGMASSTTDDTQGTTTKETNFKFAANISATNTATGTNNATSTANTGNNKIEDGNFITSTGDSVSYVDLVNVINTNIVNSVGLIEFIREVLGYEDFDMRDIFNEIFANTVNNAESTSPCSTDLCDQTSVLVDLVNQAYLENNITVTANTGQNTGSGDNGEINTGNAIASANLTNLVNTNIIDSNYLLLVFNNFDDLSGSLVLPNSEFFSSLFKNGTSAGGSFNFSNSATINNNVNVEADTGNNNATGTNSNITTGNSVATSNTTNVVNQNLLNGNNFSMLIRVHGDWTGDIFGLPKGMEWENTNDGIRLYYSNGNSTTTNNTAGNLTNNAVINNNVQVYALTGDNEVTGTKKSSITTGGAIADSTIMNIANTNVVGSNWINLIFNIYGNWNGHLAFGQPDLWLGLKANTGNRSYLRPNAQISYTYTIFNRGDTTAKDVVLENKYPIRSLNFSDKIDFKILNQKEGSLKWNIGDIKPGETIEFTTNTKLYPEFGADKRLPLPLQASVYSNQPDANNDDNSDSILLYIGEKNSDKKTPRQTFPAKFIIEKTASKDYAKIGDTIDYEINFTNKGGQLFDALLIDTMRDDDGNIINEQTWPLETIKNGETITVTYSIVLPYSFKDGTYTNTAQVVGAHKSTNLRYQAPYLSPIAKHELVVGELEAMPLLGLDDIATVCSPYLTTYLKHGQTNDSEEVIKLQYFLKEYTDDTLIISGVFDIQTKDAVNKFQQDYKGEILEPWGMTRSSGYVYYTTQKKINEIMCDDEVVFPLTETQKNEMDLFKFKQANPVSTPESVNSETFGGNLPMLDLAEEATPKPVAVKNPTISFLKTNSNKLSDLAYDRFDNWLYLLENKHTALR